MSRRTIHSIYIGICSSSHLPFRSSTSSSAKMRKTRRRKWNRAKEEGGVSTITTTTPPKTGSSTTSFSNPLLHRPLLTSPRPRISSPRPITTLPRRRRRGMQARPQRNRQSAHRYLVLHRHHRDLRVRRVEAIRNIAIIIYRRWAFLPS